MSFEKKFSVEKIPSDKVVSGKALRERVIEIENGDALLVKAPDIDMQSPLHKRLHESSPKRDTTHEIADFAEVREEVCEAFDVPMDDKHVIILEEEETNGHLPGGTQRDFRAFSVIIDKQSENNYYAEGRTWHIHLNQRLVKKISEMEGKDMTFDDFKKELEERWETIKGFVSDDNFAELDSKFRDRLSFAFKGEDGSIYRTPEGWFISGSTLSSPN